MKNYNEKEINSLIERFESRTLPRAEWTHEAHLLVAIWYTSKFNFLEALALVREKINSHNESVGTPNTDLEGYHETITRFWLLVAKRFLANRDKSELEANVNAFINSEEGHSKYPLDYYSAELLFSIKARHNWVEPNIKPWE